MYKLMRTKVRKGRLKDQVEVKKTNGNKQKKKGDGEKKTRRTRQETDVLEKNLN